MIDHEITMNCLDIITNLGKNILLSDIAAGNELVEALFALIGLI
jgi:hypothetical protein